MTKIFDKYEKISPDYHYQQVSRKSLKRYNASVEARFQKLVENISREIGNRKAKILDVGCGDGVALYLLSKKLPNLELFGVDPVEEALSVARKKMENAQFKHASAEKLPFTEGAFDIIISSDVIEHVDEPEKMLEEISRVAKDGATIIIGTPIRHSKIPLDYNHVQEFFIEDFEALMKKYFKNINIHESHNLSLTLAYNAPTKSFLNFKYLMNLLIFVSGKNPFMNERKNRMQMFSYMYAVCKK